MRLSDEMTTEAARLRGRAAGYRMAGDSVLATLATTAAACLAETTRALAALQEAERNGKA